MSSNEAQLNLIASQLHLLIEENQNLKQKVVILSESINSIVDQKILKVTDLITRYGESRYPLEHQLWLLPNFGISDFPSGSKRWRMQTVLAWEAIPVEQRKIMWNKMSIQQRKQLQKQKQGA